MSDKPTTDKPASEFEKAAAEQTGGNLVSEIWHFLGHTKKWWLLPIIVAVLLLGLLMLMGGTAVAPFIYTLF